MVVKKQDIEKLAEENFKKLEVQIDKELKERYKGAAVEIFIPSSELSDELITRIQKYYIEAGWSVKKAFQGLRFE